MKLLIADEHFRAASSIRNNNDRCRFTSKQAAQVGRILWAQNVAIKSEPSMENYQNDRPAIAKLDRLIDLFEINKRTEERGCHA